MFENRFAPTRPATPAPALKDRLPEVLALALSCLLAVVVLVRAQQADDHSSAAQPAVHAAPVATATPAAPSAPALSRSEEEVRRILQDMALHD